MRKLCRKNKNHLRFNFKYSLEIKKQGFLTSKT